MQGKLYIIYDTSQILFPLVLTIAFSILASSPFILPLSRRQDQSEQTWENRPADVGQVERAKGRKSRRGERGEGIWEDRRQRSSGNSTSPCLHLP